MRQFLGLSGWFIAWLVVTRLLRASDVVLLGIFDSAELVTTYTLTKYAPETLINIVGIVVFGITPGLGGIMGAGDLPKAVRVRTEVMVFTWLLATVAGATILLWNRSFLQLWVGAEYDAGSLPTLLIILLVTQFVLIRNDANIIDLTLNLRRKVLIGVFAAALSVLIAGVLVAVFNLGIIGLCGGFLMGRFVLSLAYPWLVGRVLGLSLGSQLQGVLRPALTLTLLFGLAAYLNDRLLITTWFSLALAVGATLGIGMVVAFYLGLRQSQRQQSLKRLGQVLRRLRPT